MGRNGLSHVDGDAGEELLVVVHAYRALGNHAAWREGPFEACGVGSLEFYHRPALWSVYIRGSEGDEGGRERGVGGHGGELELVGARVAHPDFTGGAAGET